MTLTSRLTMRATVRRFSATGADPDGHATGSWDTHEIPCWLFHPGPTEETHGEDVNALVDELRMLVGYEGDIVAGDEVTLVTDLSGATIESRTLKVTGLRRRGDGHIGISHRAVSLQAISSGLASEAVS
jgi:hypothetical protein